MPILYALLFIVVVVLVLFFVYREIFSHTLKEPFAIEEVVEDTIDENGYLLENQFTDQCQFVEVKPTDTKATNIVHFFTLPKAKFVGISTEKRHYMVVTKDKTVMNASSIKNNTKVGYCYESDKVLFDHLFKKVYRVTLEFENIASELEYVNDYCNTYDNTQNMFVDFMESDCEYFVFSVNMRYDQKLFTYFGEFYSKRLKQLDFVGDITKDPFLKNRLHDYIFSSVVDYNVIKVDEVLYGDETTPVDIEKLIANNIIDFDTTQHYLDVYHCDVPEEIQKHLKNNNRLMEETKMNLKNTTDTCDPDTKIQSLYNSPENKFGRHLYKNTRCNKSHKNLFIDIVYPFASSYNISLSALNFNTLEIHSDKFDDYIPIRNAFSYNNNNISRYKINVDPKSHPYDAFIDDIYYGAYKNKDDRTILTNSIPFDLNESLHQINFVYLDDEKKDISEIYISSKTEDVITASYTYNDESMTVNIFEGDRVFINPDTIFDVNMVNYIESKLRDGQNFYYGFVASRTDENNLKSIIIKLDDIRSEESVVQSLIGKCYDKNLNELHDKMDEVECVQADSENTWEIPCKYNYECPFFQSNSNYDNQFGGCSLQGVCQMPRGITKQSFKRHANDEENQPLCYNCPTDTDDKACCDSYKDNELLQSPDYMFKDDQGERVKKLFMFKEKEDSPSTDKCGLYINKYF